ncbi:PucR family transcriptional regulator ligand-binding domain-containing protein [uncultured Megasphaera sp.]|uniref:PucR family transcriptional regulator n=1 Tax=uncultured Megasphaera sp. TaxID=165188 RepID=UPI00265A9ABD|nr:PucR family transcriptional regulator ligand-binding domain-containing protein [uncultured Megasphaera sp.]
MSISVSHLFHEQENPYKLSLLAGQGGLYREVSWIQVMEDRDYAPFLVHNELIFTTGLGKGDDEQWLEKFVQALIQAGSAGLVLNVGKYIFLEDISDDLRALCDRQQFPLFSMPWNVRLVDVTQSFLYAIFLTKRAEYELIDACQTLLFQTDTEGALQCLSLHGFREDQTCEAVVIVVSPGTGQEQAERIVTSYKGLLNSQQIPYLIFPLKQGIFLLRQIPAGQEGCRDAVVPAEGESVQAVGYGMTVPSLQELPVSYRQAVCAAFWAAATGKKQCRFADLGVYALLFSQSHPMAMETLYQQTLGPVLAYDEQYGRELFPTLEAYLRHSGSIQAVAAELCVHRNTVSYRVQKIKELLHCDLSDEQTRFTYLLACHIHHYRGICRQYDFNAWF